MVRRPNLTALKDPDWKDPYVPPLNTHDELREEERRLRVRIGKGKKCRKCGRSLTADSVGVRFDPEENRQHASIRCGCFPQEPQLYTPQHPYQAYMESGIGDSITAMQVWKGLNKIGMKENELARIDPGRGGALQERQDVALLEPLTVEGFQQRLAVVQYVATLLKEGVDFGHIPGTRGKGKSLLKPGADKFRMALNIPFRMVIHGVAEDREMTKTSENSQTGKPVTRHWIRATVEAVCEVRGQVFGSIIRMSDSFEERWNGWDPDMLPDLVTERAQKRAYVELVKMISGISSEYQESMEYVDPEDVIKNKIVELLGGEAEWREWGKANLEGETWQRIHNPEQLEILAKIYKLKNPATEETSANSEGASETPPTDTQEDLPF